MKKSFIVLLAVLFLAVVTAAFFVGNHISEKKHREVADDLFNSYISRAIDTAQNKGVQLGGAAESVASNLWVAHALCDDPQISAELSNLWNELIYEEKYVGQEALLIDQLEDILSRYS